MVVPDNLYIIGTMNTADRSIGSIDYAERRRFAFVSLPSDIGVAVETWDTIASYTSDIDVDKYKGAIKKLYEAIKGIKLSSDVSREDIMLGHSYFMFDKDKCSRKNNDGIYEINDELIDLYMDYRVEYQMKPILMEYVNDGLIERSEERLIKELAWENFKK